MGDNMGYLKRELKECKYYLVAFFAVIVLAFAATDAKADYMSVSIGESRYKKNDIWEQNATGYESIRGMKSTAYMVGYVIEGKNSDWRFAYKDYGDFKLGALWGDPDNPVCHTCSNTTSSYQTGTVESFSIAWQPKKTVLGIDFHATIGLEYYDADWIAHFFHAVDANQNDMAYSGSANIHSTDFTALLGIGARKGSVIIDFEYAPVNAEGKGQKWGGGGAYKGATMFTIGIIHEFK